MADKTPRSAQSDAEALAFSGQLGKTIQRLRKAYNLSLSELSEQSGVAKSIISQIERNETNPTLATIWRLSQALDVSIDRVMTAAHDASFVEDIPPNDMPVLTSEDGLMQLTITGWSKTVEWLQWYDVSSKPGGVLDSEGHQRGSIECLSVLEGRFEVISGQEMRIVEAGGTVRYRCDRQHIVKCLEGGASGVGRATMVCILKAAVME
ncbi:MAG: XRE family transcriptional regulator [Hyphomicrobiales bacterium]